MSVTGIIAAWNSAKKIIISACALVIAAVLAGTSVYADWEQEGRLGVHISGMTDCGHEGELIGIDVWAPGKGLSDLRAEEDKRKYADILVYRNQTVSGEDGVYDMAFELKETSPNGFYTAHIRSACGAESAEEIFFCNPADNREALEELSEKQSTSEVYEFCIGEDENGNPNRYRLGFVYKYDIDMYAAELMFNFIKSAEFSVDDKAGAIAAYKKAVLISALHRGELSDIFDYDNELGIDVSRIGRFNTDKIATARVRTAVTNRLSKKVIKSYAQFESELYEGFVLAVVRYPEGYADIADLTEEFADEIGISGRASDAACIRVMKKEFKSYSELCGALSNTDSGSSFPNGGSGGSGGGSGGSGGTSYDSGYVTDSEKTKININIFDDIDDVPWAVDAIVELAEQGIINGKEEKRFFPNDKITREETAKLIVAAFLSEYPAAEAEFSDVDENAWYAQYVKTACGCGIVNGIGDGRFGTGSFITREDMAVIAYRTAEYRGFIDDSESGSGADEFIFEDDGSISDYAKKAVYALEKEGIINGVGNGYFEPKGGLTRAQAAMIIYGVYTINR